MLQPIGNNLVVSQIVKKSPFIYIIEQFYCQLNYQEKGKQMPHKNLCMNVHSSSIHNSQKVKTNQISIDEWINKVSIQKQKQKTRTPDFHTKNAIDF